MAHRTTTYRPGTEDEPNVPPSRIFRERSPRRNGRRSPGRDSSAGQGSRRLERTDNRSCSPDRSSSISGTSRRISESERRRREYADFERDLRTKQALEWKKDISEKSGDRRQPDAQPKDMIDRDWDKSQAAIHSRIGRSADDVIRASWQGGAKVTKENSPGFAAAVLLYVRKKFYSEFAENEVEVRAAGYEPKRDPPNGPYTQRLRLEDMKWVYDTKIKPFTDPYGKELFLCNGCANKNRLYTFESVLQHYASKHTSTLSKGAVVVNWRAEWPEDPPFVPEPDNAMNTGLSVADCNTNSANGPIASLRGLGGYLDNKELEKKKRDQEIREREIMIKETKEEIERKERERARRGHEIKQKQVLAKPSERHEGELEDQTTYKKSLSESERGGIGTTSAQRDGPLTLPDITDKPQIDRGVTTETQKGTSLPEIQIPDAKSRPRNPTTRSVEMGNMDSSDLRANQRLHLAGLFTRFMSEVSQQTALQLRRDSTKKILEQKTAAYNKAHIMHREFPSAEESTKASKERARKEFEKVENELIQKREASLKLSEEISEIVYPQEEPSEGDRIVAAKILDLEGKLAQYQAESELVKMRQQQLDERCKTFMTENDKRIPIESIGNGFSSVRQEIFAFAAKTASLEAEVASLKQGHASSDLRSSLEGLTVRVNGLEQQQPSEDTLELKRTIDTLSSRVDKLQQTGRVGEEPKKSNQDEDTADLRSTILSLSSRIDDLEAPKLEQLSKTVEILKSTLATQSEAINDRSEMQSVHSSLKALSRSEGDVRVGFAKLQSQMQTLGKELRALKMVERGRRPSDVSVRDSNGLSNDVRIAIHDEIKAQQEAVDLVLDHKLGNLEEQLGDLNGRLIPLETQLREVDGSLNSFRSQYVAQIDRIASDVGGVRSDITNTREEINALRQNEFYPLQMAYTNLDYRMNNLSTEHLARQILGQLDAHIRGSEKNVATLELRVQELHMLAKIGDGSTVSKRDVEESLRNVKKELADGVDERLDKVKSIFVGLNNDLGKELMQLRTKVDTNQSKWQNIKADVEALQANFTETMKSLRADVDSIGPTLRTFQYDLGTTKTNCSEATASLKVEIAKASQIASPEKRDIDSPEPTKANGHKRRRKGRSLSDSDYDV